MLRTADVYHLDLHHLIFKPSLLKEIILLGIPGGLQASLTNLSNMSVQKWTNYFGSSAMAGAGAAKKIDKFLNSTTSAVSYGTATFIAQNHSSGKTDRVRKGTYNDITVSKGQFVAYDFTGKPVEMLEKHVKQANEEGADTKLVISYKESDTVAYGNIILQEQVNNNINCVVSSGKSVRITKP
jgi:beta-lactam-binding protein with PASTA domain